MKALLMALILLATLPPRGGAEGPGEERKLAAAARAILEPWQKAQARPTERYLHVVCWTPSDREFPANHRERLPRMLLHIQDFYAREMERNGFGRCAFKLQRDKEGRVLLHEVRGSHPTARYGKKSGSAIRAECLPVLKKAGIDADQETIAIFCNLATWDEKELRFSHESPYYAGGHYRRGTAWQLDSPELDVGNLAKKAPLIRDGEYGRISLGKHNSIFIGGMAHELGHAFGLPHTRERPEEKTRGTSLMGSGNQTYGDELRGEGRGTFLTFADAMRLASHPQFSGHLEARENRARPTLSDLRIRADGKAIVVSGTIKGEPPVYAVVGYFDPEGNSDYNQTSAVAVPGSDGRFELRSDALAWGKQSVLRLVPLHVNGGIGDGQALGRMRFPYRVAADGTPDLSAIRTRQVLEPVVAAMAEGNAALARRLAGQIKEKEAAAIAAVLTDATAPTERPSEDRGKSSERGLTSFKVDAAAVGWGRPTFNRLPDGSLLLESAGVIFATGLYAHAPARHEYTLGGQWEVLKGKVGIATGHAGSVRFTIKGDGRELWSSPIVRADQLVPFEVSVKGVKSLELITTPGEDGPSGDWGLWLEPHLLRSR